MNCETVYIIEDADDDQEKYTALAEIVNRAGEEVELYAVALSRCTKEHRFFASYDYYLFESGQRPKFKVKEGELMLFVQGKDWHMNRHALNPFCISDSDKAIYEKVNIGHPERVDGCDWFEDLIEF